MLFFAHGIEIVPDAQNKSACRHRTLQRQIVQRNDFTVWFVRIKHIALVADDLFVFNHPKPELVVTGKPDPLRHNLTPWRHRL